MSPEGLKLPAVSRTSQILTVFSLPPVASRWPSGLKATFKLGPGTRAGEDAASFLLLDRAASRPRSSPSRRCSPKPGAAVAAEDHSSDLPLVGTERADLLAGLGIPDLHGSHRVFP